MSFPALEREYITRRLIDDVPNLAADLVPQWADHFISVADTLQLMPQSQREEFFRFCVGMMQDVDFAVGPPVPNASKL